MKLFRTLALSALVLSQSGCFSILHFIDLAENGTLSVQWSFRFSKSLEEMGKKQGDKPDASSGGLSSEVEKGKQEIPGKLGAVAKDLKVESIQSEYDSGIRVSFSVPQFAKVDFTKVTPEEFPYMPQYVAASRQLIFHFAPVKKDKKEEKPSETPPPVQGDGDKPADQPAAEGADDMGKQIGKLFLSSVRYQIVLGRGLRPVSATIRQEGKEKKLELQTLGDQSLLDLPLFALYGDKELPFDLIIQLK